MNIHVCTHRLAVFALLLIGGFSISFAQSNRTEEAIEKKLKDYRAKLEETTGAIRKKQQELKDAVIADTEKGLSEQASKGRLDLAVQYYGVKRAVERKNLKESDYANLPEANKELLVKYLEEEAEAEQRIYQTIDEENRALYMYSLGVLTKAKALSPDKGLKKEELNWLTSFLMQFPLPKGAEFPQNGEKIGILHCSYYTGSFDNLEDIAKKGRLMQTFPSSSIALPWGTQDEFFGLIWEGLYYAETSGEYSFSISADDFVRLMLDGKVVITRSKPGPRRDRGTIYLEKGWRSFKLSYTQLTGPKYIQLKVKTPDSQEEMEIPSTKFATKAQAPKG